MKKNKIILVGVGIVLLFLIIGFIFIKNINEKTFDSPEENLENIISYGLGDLCSSEEECKEYCSNNKGQCENYCEGNENELCSIIFPSQKSSTERQKESTPREDECEGTKVKFDYAPVNLEKTLVMLPRGLMVGGHVTPVNHHYFQNFDNNEFDIEVYSPGKGYITSIGHMPGAEEGKDYNINIEYSCTIVSNYIYVSDLPEKIYQHIQGKSYIGVRIPVEAGEIIGYYKNNLDYNLFDEETTLTGFVVPEHYAVESFKTHIVSNTYEYFNEPVKSKLLAISVRTAEPVSGKIDYDIDGKLVGNWFLVGSNYYADVKGHLSFVYDYIDPKRIVISIAGYEGQESRQFGVKTNGPNPAQVGVENGLVKYELVDYDYIAPDGNSWDRRSATKSLKTISNEMARGVVLVQLIENRKIKFEAFPGKNGGQVSEFTGDAKIYER